MNDTMTKTECVSVLSEDVILGISNFKYFYEGLHSSSNETSDNRFSDVTFC